MAPSNSVTTSAGGNLEAGFAKLRFKDFSYFMQTYSIILGRDPKNGKKGKVDLDISGPDRDFAISRRHARIFYDFERKRFSLEVLGKNGCIVEGVLHLPGGGPIKLDSRDRLQIGQKEFYFLLPTQYIVCPPTYRHGSNASATFQSDENGTTADQHGHTASAAAPPARIGTTAPPPAHIDTPAQPARIGTTILPPAHIQNNAKNENVVGIEAQGEFMNHNKTSFGELGAHSSHHITIEPTVAFGGTIIFPPAHTQNNAENEYVVGIEAQGEFMNHNKTSFGELGAHSSHRITIEPTVTFGGTVILPPAHIQNNAENENEVGIEAQGEFMNHNKTPFGELGTCSSHRITIEPTVALGGTSILPPAHIQNNAEIENVVGIEAQGEFMNHNNTSLGELGTRGSHRITIEPTVALGGQPVNNLEIRTADKNKDNQQEVLLKEEEGALASIGIVISDICGLKKMVPIEKLYLELIARFGATWPQHQAQKHLTPEAGSSAGIESKPWLQLMYLLKRYPERFTVMHASCEEQQEAPVCVTLNSLWA